MVVPTTSAKRAHGTQEIIAHKRDRRAHALRSLTKTRRFRERYRYDSRSARHRLLVRSLNSPPQIVTPILNASVALWFEFLHYRTDIDRRKSIPCSLRRLERYGKCIKRVFVDIADIVAIRRKLNIEWTRIRIITNRFEVAQRSGFLTPGDPEAGLVFS